MELEITNIKQFGGRNQYGYFTYFATPVVGNDVVWPPNQVKFSIKSDHAENFNSSENAIVSFKDYARDGMGNIEHHKSPKFGTITFTLKSPTLNRVSSNAGQHVSQKGAQVHKIPSSQPDNSTSGTAHQDMVQLTARNLAIIFTAVEGDPDRFESAVSMIYNKSLDITGSVLKLSYEDLVKQ